jgi:putative inorganic carbon (hco3(-)) transporter
MPIRAVWRPQWHVWTLLGLAALASIYGAKPRLLSGHWLILTPCLLVVGLMTLRRLWELPPAVTACGAVVLTIFSGGWSQIGLGGIPLNRLLIGIVLLQVLLRAPGMAHVPRIQIRNVHLLLCLAIVYVLASAAASGTLANEDSVLSLIDQFGVVPYLMFLVAPAVFAGTRERNWLLATLVGLGAYLGLTAIFESLGPHSLVFPSYIVHVDEALPEARAGGPFQSSVAEGFATFACATAAVIAFVQWRGQRRRYFAAAAAVVCILGCFLTLERGVWLAAAAATVVTALATQQGRRWLIPGVSACTVVIAGALLLSPALANKASTRLNDTPSVWVREDQTSAGLRMVSARPLFGFGWDRFTRDDLEYFRQASDHPMGGYSQGSTEESQAVVPLHDTYLSSVVELGLVGASLWFASMFWGIGGAIFSRGPADLRPWKLGLIAIAVFFFVVALFNPYQAPFSMLMLWVWAGVALGIAPPLVQRQQATTASQTSGDVTWVPA